ncbi:hypothetical protein Tco_1083285 [Tanacetum coccineum]
MAVHCSSTPKEELVTLDKPESPNPFLPADEVEFTFEEIAFTTNNEVALLYTSHPNSEYFREVSDFISKCCLKEAFKDMEIKLPRDLEEIPTKLETFTSTISSLISQVAELKNIQWELPAELQDLPVLVSLVQKQLKTLDSLPSLLNKVTKTLNTFVTVVENTLGATTKDVPLAVQATASPAEGENNTTKDAETNLKNELVDLLGINVVEQYHNMKLLFDKYCDKMLKRRKM